MTEELDRLAREIAASQKMHHADEIHLVRLGLEAGEQRGMKLQRERDAEIADEHFITADDDVQQAYSQSAIDIGNAIRTQS